MANENVALVYVDASVDGSSRVQVFSMEVPKADALRIFAAARRDPRSIKEDLASFIAEEVRGDFLYVGYFEMAHGKILDEEVCFPLPHAFDAIEQHFSIKSDDLKAALVPENLAELVAERSKDLETLLNELPELMKDVELLKAKDAAVREAVAAELRAEIAAEKKSLH